MKFRDYCFQALMALAVLSFVALFVLRSVRDLILVDAQGAPMDRQAFLPCPSCNSMTCFLRDYPVYNCLSCGRVHHCRRSGGRFVLTAVSPPRLLLDGMTLTAVPSPAAGGPSPVP